MKYDLAAFRHLNGVHFGANRTLAARTAAYTTPTIVDCNAAGPAFGQRLSPIRHLGNHIERS